MYNDFYKLIASASCKKLVRLQIQRAKTILYCHLLLLLLIHVGNVALVTEIALESLWVTQWEVYWKCFLAACIG